MAALGAALGWQNALYVFALSHVAGALVVLGLTFISLARPRPRNRVPISALSSPSSGRSSSRLGCDQPPRSNGAVTARVVRAPGAFDTTAPLSHTGARAVP
jgi:hypothetical protein